MLMELKVTVESVTFVTVIVASSLLLTGWRPK